MKTKTLIFPDIRSMDGWAKYLQEARYKHLEEVPQRLRISFQNLHFISPFQIVLLACLIEEYHLKGVTISFIGSDSNIEVYLRKIRFFDYWKQGFNRNKYTQHVLGTALCLWKVNRDMMTDYITFAQRYFENNYFDGKNLQVLNTTLSELFNNIYDHAKSKVDGYAFTQYFPNINVIRIGVCDFGVGIPTTVNRYLKDEGEQQISSDTALKRAFEKGFSVKSAPHNRGFGLDTLKTAVIGKSDESDPSIPEQSDPLYDTKII